MAEMVTVNHSDVSPCPLNLKSQLHQHSLCANCQNNSHKNCVNKLDNCHIGSSSGKDSRPVTSLGNLTNVQNSCDCHIMKLNSKHSSGTSGSCNEPMFCDTESDNMPCSNDNDNMNSDESSIENKSCDNKTDSDIVSVNITMQKQISSESDLPCISDIDRESSSQQEFTKQTTYTTINTSVLPEFDLEHLVQSLYEPEFVTELQHHVDQLNIGALSEELQKTCVGDGGNELLTSTQQIHAHSQIYDEDNSVLATLMSLGETEQLLTGNSSGVSTHPQLEAEYAPGDTGSFLLEADQTGSKEDIAQSLILQDIDPLDVDILAATIQVDPSLDLFHVDPTVYLQDDPVTATVLSDLPALGSNDEEEDDEIELRRVQVGEAYQADIPEVVGPGGDDQQHGKTEHLEWDPSQFDNECTSSYLQEARAIYQTLSAKDRSEQSQSTAGNDYLALSILHQYAYNSSQALNHLRKLTRWTDNPLLLWSEKEWRLFDESYVRHGKNFCQIQEDVGTRSLKEVVHFYYKWKRSKRTRIYSYKKRLAGLRSFRSKGSQESDMHSESESEASPWKRPRQERSSSPVRSLMNSRHKVPHPPDLDLQACRPATPTPPDAPVHKCHPLTPVKSVPSHIKSVPIAVKSIPSPTKSVPSSTKPAPIPVKSVPSPTKPAPIPVKSVPSPTKPAPIPVKSVPSPTKPGPVKSIAIPTSTYNSGNTVSAFIDLCDNKRNCDLDSSSDSSDMSSLSGASRLQHDRSSLPSSTPAPKQGLENRDDDLQSAKSVDMHRSESRSDIETLDSPDIWDRRKDDHQCDFQHSCNLRVSDCSGKTCEPLQRGAKRRHDPGCLEKNFGQNRNAMAGLLHNIKRLKRSISSSSSQSSGRSDACSSSDTDSCGSDEFQCDHVRSIAKPVSAAYQCSLPSPPPSPLYDASYTDYSSDSK